MKEILLIATTSAATNITSQAVDLCDLTHYCVHVVFTGSNVVGTFSLQGSNENDNFITIPQSVTAITASDDLLMPVENGVYRYVRAVWAYTSGAGNITARFVMKENVVKTS